MKGTRHQQGYLYRKGSLWLLRYYDSEFSADGLVRRVQKTKKLAKLGLECPNKTAARELAMEFLDLINLARNTPEAAMTLTCFTEHRYLPFVEMHKRISTFHGYRNMWRRYLKPRGEIMLREFRTVDGERILEAITAEHKLTSTTLAHIEAFLSGIFRYAKRQGAMNSENPVRDVVLPKGKPAGETHAYSLKEITQMLTVLPEPARTIVAVAAFTGVRKGELRGLLWENYDGEQVLISQSFWRGHALEPKTRHSKAPVPVIAQLARLLDSHRCLSGNPANGLMFLSPVGKPVNLDALVVDVIVPLVTKQESSGMVGMRFGVAWRRIFTSLEFPTRSSNESCDTPTWQSRRTATSRPRTPKSRRRCSDLSDHSTMHLVCTSRVSRESI
jgi:integrase